MAELTNIIKASDFTGIYFIDIVPTSVSLKLTDFITQYQQDILRTLLGVV